VEQYCVAVAAVTYHDILKKDYGYAKRKESVNDRVKTSG